MNSEKNLKILIKDKKNEKTEGREDSTNKDWEKERAGTQSACLVLTAPTPKFSFPIECLLYFLCPWDGKAGRETLVKALNPQGMTESRKWTKKEQMGNAPPFPHFLPHICTSVQWSHAPMVWSMSQFRSILPSSYVHHFQLHLLALRKSVAPFLGSRLHRQLGNSLTTLLASSSLLHTVTWTFKFTSIVKKASYNKFNY